VRNVSPSCRTLANCVIHLALECGIGDPVSTKGWLVLVVERNRVLHTVASAEEALEMLFANWPVTNGRAFFSAMQACAGTMTDTVAQGEA